MASDAQVVAIIKTVNEDVERLIKKLTLDVTANLIEETPVDVGWARANWVPEIGKPYDNGMSHVVDRKEREALVDAQATEQNDGLAKVLGYTLPQGVIHITNNVPYIELLNEGSSKQAPSAYVQGCIERAVAQNQVTDGK